MSTKMTYLVPIPVHGEEGKEFCQCGELATKEIIYYRYFDGLMKKFKESICELCLNDGNYFRAKTIISIENIEPQSNRIFTNDEVYDKFRELFDIN